MTITTTPIKVDDDIVNVQTELLEAHPSVSKLPWTRYLGEVIVTPVNRYDANSGEVQTTYLRLADLLSGIPTSDGEQYATLYEGQRCLYADHTLRVEDRPWTLRRRVRSDAGVPFRGVSPGSKGKFVARITVDGKRRTLGNFVTPEEAALAYDRAALEAHGHAACLNYILPKE